MKSVTPIESDPSGPAVLCAKISREVISLRAAGSPPNEYLSAMMHELHALPANTVLDALALAAMAKHLLAVWVNEDPLCLDSAESAHYALSLLERAVGVLEGETGYSADGFIGSSAASSN